MMFAWFFVLLDKIDDRVLNHRFYSVCRFVYKHYPEDQADWYDLDYETSMKRAQAELEAEKEGE